MEKIHHNSVSLAGEFAVLSQLALRGYDANMTLGNTKGVDILVSNPKNSEMYQLEVKTNLKKDIGRPSVSKTHGKTISSWIMKREHEKIISKNLFYCFVNISKGTNLFKFFIVPSRVVAEYISKEHSLWLNEADIKTKRKDGDMRTFRIGLKNEKYKVLTPITEKYENNWEFNT